LFFLRKVAKVILVRIEGVPAAGIRDDAVGGRGLVEGRGEVSDVRTRGFQALADHRVRDLFLEDAQGGQDLINRVLVQGRGVFVRGLVFGSLVAHAGLLPGCWARRLSAPAGRALTVGTGLPPRSPPLKPAAAPASRPAPGPAEAAKAAQ